MPFNLIITIFYLIFYLNFFIMFVFIPFILFYCINPIGSIKFFIICKNFIFNSLGFIVKKIMFSNVYVNSNELYESITEYNHKNKKIIISNHPSEFDFLLASIFLTNTNLINSNIGLAKKNIGYIIPIIGFIGLFSGDVFLHRNINMDINKLNKKLNFNLMILYPEGTCFNKDRKLISDNYCDKNSLIKFKYHLYPRTTGLEIIINNNIDIKYIYDLTLIYDEIKKKDYGNHYNLFNCIINKFKISNKIYIQINKYKIDRKNDFNKKMIENIYLSKDNFISKFDINCNNFVPIKYEYFKGFGCFIFVNFICILSIYLYIKYNFIKYLYFFQLIIYYLYFYFFV